MSLKNRLGSWQPVAEVIGVIVAILALVILGLQFVSQNRDTEKQLEILGEQQRSIQDQQRTMAEQTLTTQLIAVDQEMLNHPDLRGCFVNEVGTGCPGASFANDPRLLATVNGLAILHLDLFDGLYSARDFIYEAGDSTLTSTESADQDSSWPAWAMYIVNTFKASQVTCDALVVHQSEYTKTFVDAVRESESCPNL